jgi:hypothetical protein
MPLPPPEVGLVIRYGYLWRREADRRQRQSKDRPACIVAAVVGTEETTIVLLPITRSPPRSDSGAIELPAKVKAHLGLDPEPSWVIVSECNVDAWPSPDVIPIQRGQYAYGMLPPRLFRQIRDLFVGRARAKRMLVVRR